MLDLLLACGFSSVLTRSFAAVRFMMMCSNLRGILHSLIVSSWAIPPIFFSSALFICGMIFWAVIIAPFNYSGLWSGVFLFWKVPVIKSYICSAVLVGMWGYLQERFFLFICFPVEHGADTYFLISLILIISMKVIQSIWVDGMKFFHPKIFSFPS